MSLSDNAETPRRGTNRCRDWSKVARVTLRAAKARVFLSRVSGSFVYFFQMIAKTCDRGLKIVQKNPKPRKPATIRNAALHRAATSRRSAHSLCCSRTCPYLTRTMPVAPDTHMGCRTQLAGGLREAAGGSPAVRHKDVRSPPGGGAPPHSHGGCTERHAGRLRRCRCCEGCLSSPPRPAQNMSKTCPPVPPELRPPCGDCRTACVVLVACCFGRFGIGRTPFQTLWC